MSDKPSNEPSYAAMDEQFVQDAFSSKCPTSKDQQPTIHKDGNPTEGHSIAQDLIDFDQQQQQGKKSGSARDSACLLCTFTDKTQAPNEKNVNTGAPRVTSPSDPYKKSSELAKQHPGYDGQASAVADGGDDHYEADSKREGRPESDLAKREGQQGKEDVADDFTDDRTYNSDEKDDRYDDYDDEADEDVEHDDYDDGGGDFWGPFY